MQHKQRHTHSGSSLFTKQLLFGYERLVFLAAPSTPSSTPSAAPTLPTAPSSGGTSSPATTVSLIQAELDDVLTSPELERKYSPRALLQELLGRSSLPPHTALHALEDMLQARYGIIPGGDVVGDIAKRYRKYSIDVDNTRATELLQDVSSALGLTASSEPGSVQRAHPKVVETITKGVILDSLDVSLIGGTLETLPVSLSELRQMNGGLGRTSPSLANFIKELEQKQIEAWTQHGTVSNHFLPYLGQLRQNFAGTVARLKRTSGLPDELYSLLDQEPKVTFRELTGRLNTSEDLPVLKKIKKAKVKEIVQHLTEDYREVMDNAIRRELRAGVPTVSPEHIIKECGIQPGSVISMNIDGQTRIIEIADIIAREDTTGAPPVREDATLILRAGGSETAMSGPDFMNFWKHHTAKVLVETPLSRELFFDQYNIQEEQRQVSPLYMCIGDQIYPIRPTGEQSLRMGGRKLSWGALQGFVLMKNVKDEEVVFKSDLDDSDKDKVVKGSSGPRKSFWQGWTSIFASPKQVIGMAKSVIEYFKEEWEQSQKTKGYELLHNMLPEGIFKDEIEAKLSGMQDAAMQDKLKVIKNRTSSQVAESAFQVFDRARKGQHVNDALLKAYLLAVYDKGGELYYGKSLNKYRNTFFIYEALGGKINDAAYTKILKQERALQPNLKQPPEWRVIMEYLDQNKKRFGPTFFDTFDTTVQAAKDPQMQKQEKSLADVNNKRQLIDANINEVYGGRLWRAFQGFKTIIGREQGVLSAFEIYFHLLSFGNIMDEKQRKEFKIMGAGGHMPFLFSFANIDATTNAQRTMEKAIQTLASTPKYQEKSVIKVKGESYDLKNFKYTKLFTPGKELTHRPILEAIYGLMGQDIYNYLSGTGSYKVFVEPQFRKYVADTREVLGAYEVGSHEPSVFNYYTTFFSTNNADKTGVANKVIIPGQLSGSFTFQGQHGDKAETYMNNLLDELEKMYHIIHTPEAVDPLTGEVFTDNERTQLGKYFDILQEELINNFVKRMDEGTHRLFLASPNRMADRMLRMKFPIESYHKLHGKVLTQAPVPTQRGGAQAQTA